MPLSTQAEIARLASLNADERFVLSSVAYGYDLADTQRGLTHKVDRVTSENAFSLMQSVCGKLGLADIEKERDRVHKAGKIFLDGEEARRKAGLAEADAAARASKAPDVPANAEASDDHIEGDDDTTGDAHTASPGDDEGSADTAADVNQPPEEKTMNDQVNAKALQVARATAKRYVDAKASGEEVPHIRDVYEAVLVMSEADMKRTEIGTHFGYQGNSAATWATTLLRLGSVSEGVWQQIAGTPVPMSFLVKLSDLDPRAQEKEIKIKLRGREDKKSAPKGAASPPKAVRGAKGGGNGASRVATPKDSGREIALPAARSAVEIQPQGNGHDSIAALLPVRISLVGLGPFADVDIASINLGVESTAQRGEMIKAHREAGFEPVEIVMHPALPAQMLFVKASGSE